MAPSLELVSPIASLRDSYRSLVSEFLERGEKLIPFVLGFEHADFDAMLAQFADCSRGIGLPEGFVAHSTYWLVYDHAHVVGVSNIRHSLTPALCREGGNVGYGIRPTARGRRFGTEILRQSLHRAGEIGLVKVLLTCAKTNVPSVQVILRNGGVLDSEEYLPERGEVVQRYIVKVVAGGQA